MRELPACSGRWSPDFEGMMAVFYPAIKLYKGI
jgi:hypothetical protein